MLGSSQFEVSTATTRDPPGQCRAAALSLWRKCPLHCCNDPTQQRCTCCTEAAIYKETGCRASSTILTATLAACQSTGYSPQRALPAKREDACPAPPSSPSCRSHRATSLPCHLHPLVPQQPSSIPHSAPHTQALPCLALPLATCAEATAIRNSVQQPTPSKMFLRTSCAAQLAVPGPAPKSSRVLGLNPGSLTASSLKMRMEAA